MMRKFWLGWFFLVGALVMGNVKCGRGTSDPQNSAFRDLAGVMAVEALVVPEGRTQVIEKDLVVFAEKDIQIDGTLNVKEGVSLALIARGHLTINGQIMGSQTPTSVSSLSLRSLFLSEAFAADSGDWILSGDQVFISSTSTLSAPPGVTVSIATHDDNGKITIKGTIKTPNGKDAQNRNENGQNAGSIEIGTLRAKNKAESYAGKFGKKINTDQPAAVKLSGTLDAGSGGNGFSDEVGVDNGAALDLHGTHGGDGGEINIHAMKVEVSGATLSAGDGGDGGNAGNASNGGTHATDGKRDGEKGRDLAFGTGKGGKGGDIDILTGPDGAVARIQEGQLGRGGKAGSVYASAGNGGPWGDGGNTSGTIGEPGQMGWYGSDGNGTLLPLKPFAHFKNGGNGGDSHHPKHSGGSGGQVDIKGRDGRDLTLSDPVEIANYGNGGNGFNGCASNPPTNGTDGGDAYQGKYSLMARKAPYSLDKHSFWGGNGGDGTRYAGYGGIQGSDDQPGRIGDWGKSGKKCPIQTAALTPDPSKPYVVSLPSEPIKPKVVSLRPAQTEALIQSAPPAPGMATLVLEHTPDSDRQTENVFRQALPSSAFPGFHPHQAAQFEEEIRSLPERFDPRAFQNF